jgi:hypothetical protein
VCDGPLAKPIETRPWLLLAPEHAALAWPLRAALWRATMASRLTVAA